MDKPAQKCMYKAGSTEMDRSTKQIVNSMPLTERGYSSIFEAVSRSAKPTLFKLFIYSRFTPETWVHGGFEENEVDLSSTPDPSTLVIGVAKGAQRILHSVRYRKTFFRTRKGLLYASITIPRP